MPAASAQILGFSASAEAHAECFRHHDHWTIHEEGSASAGGPNLPGTLYIASVVGEFIGDFDQGTTGASAWDSWVGDVNSGTLAKVTSQASAFLAGVPMAAAGDADQDRCP